MVGSLHLNRSHNRKLRGATLHPITSVVLGVKMTNRRVPTFGQVRVKIKANSGGPAIAMQIIAIQCGMVSFCKCYLYIYRFIYFIYNMQDRKKKTIGHRTATVIGATSEIPIIEQWEQSLEIIAKEIVVLTILKL